MSKKVVIASACRTPLGSFGGTLKDTPAAQLGSVVIKEAISRAGIKATDVDEVLMGCVIQAGLGQNVARQASLYAGLDNSVPAQTINVVCGSGLNAVNMAAEKIIAGGADVMVAGGMESMSMAPFALEKARYGYRMGHGKFIDTMIKDALWDVYNDYHMIQTADNVAEQWKITREDCDKFAASSQNKAEKARAEGKFKEEIVPVEIKVKKETKLFDTDEYIREGVTAEGISGMKSINQGGVTTAANASGINDGAAAVVVMSEEKAKELGVTPLATWLGGALGGVDPKIMGVGPIESTKKVLARLNLTIDDIDLYEANEAFAAQALAVGKDLGFDPEKLNVNGGAIALGHPVGASGCRILVTLLHEMKRRDVKRGLATLCIGGGMGCSMIVERE